MNKRQIIEKKIAKINKTQHRSLRIFKIEGNIVYMAELVNNETYVDRKMELETLYCIVKTF